MTRRISSQPSATPAAGRRFRPSGGPQQIDLFGNASSISPMKTPAWQELPEETRSALTSLLARLLLEHAQASRAVSQTEASHDL